MRGFGFPGPSVPDVMPEEEDADWFTPVPGHTSPPVEGGADLATRLVLVLLAAGLDLVTRVAVAPSL